MKKPLKKPVTASSKNAAKSTVRNAVPKTAAQKKAVAKIKAAAVKTVKPAVKNTGKNIGTKPVKTPLKKITGKITAKPVSDKKVKSVPKSVVSVKTVKKPSTVKTVLKKTPSVKTKFVKPAPEKKTVKTPVSVKPENILFFDRIDSAAAAAVPVKQVPLPVLKDVYSAEELASFEQKLRQLRSQLRGDVSTMADAALSQSMNEASGDLSSVPLHPADAGTDNFEQEQTLAFIQSRSERLEDVEEALERIKDKTYGICERCNCKIPKARLNYLPYVTMCVKCTEIAEREEE